MRDVSRHLAGWLRLVGTLEGDAWARSSDGVTWAVTDIPWPMFNGGVAAPDAGLDAVDRALADLRACGLPWFWFVLPQTPAAVIERVVAAGATLFDERSPWMEAPREALDQPDPPPGVEIVEGTDEESVGLWAHALQAAYGFPDAGRDGWMEAARRRGPIVPQFRVWTAVRDGTAVAVTLGYVADGVTGQFGVGVMESERRRGYGRLITLVPPARMDAPIAGHWATPEGEKLYARPGDGHRRLGDPLPLPTGVRAKKPGDLVTWLFSRAGSLTPMRRRS